MRLKLIHLLIVLQERPSSLDYQSADSSSHLSASGFTGLKDFQDIRDTSSLSALSESRIAADLRMTRIEKSITIGFVLGSFRKIGYRVRHQ